MSSEIHVVLKNKEHHKSPFERVTSSKCQVWFKGAKNMRRNEKENGAICQECKSFFRYVKRMNTRNASGSKESLVKRLKSSSNFGISKLIPVSKQRRLKAVSWNREELRKKIRMYETRMKEYHINLDNEQNNEMEKVVGWINKNAVNELETLMLEGLDSDAELPDIVRESWNKDTLDRGQFYRDQFNNQGKHL